MADSQTKRTKANQQRQPTHMFVSLTPTSEQHSSWLVFLNPRFCIQYYFSCIVKRGIRDWRLDKENFFYFFCNVSRFVFFFSIVLDFFVLLISVFKIYFFLIFFVFEKKKEKFEHDLCSLFSRYT